MKTLFGCKADDLVAMKFCQAHVTNTMWQMDITDLHYISISTNTFPAHMRRIATYWVNQKEGKHKPPSQAFKDAQKLNWALRQLEGMAGQIGSLKYNVRQKRTDLDIALDNAQGSIQYAIDTIREYNLQKTGKPPRSVRKEIKELDSIGAGFYPERLSRYMKQEKPNV